MFKDIAGHWAKEAINRLARLNILNGYTDGTFKPDEPITRAETAAMLNKYDTRRKQLVRECVPSVVRVQTDKSLGSGVVLDKQGYIATNVHCVMDENGLDPAKFVHVYLDALPKTPFNARIVLGYPQLDVAILKIDGVPEQYLVPAEIANSVELLDEVFCIGNPLGYANTVSQGVITFIDRKVSATWLQTDAAINPGNSGGGAFNILGQLVGLPTWKITHVKEDSNISAEGMGFLAPYYVVREVYEKAKSSTKLTIIHEL